MMYFVDFLDMSNFRNKMLSSLERYTWAVIGVFG